MSVTNSNYLYIMAALGSIALMVVDILTHNFNINLDGILYLNVAASYVEGGYSQAVSQYGWPFYSIMIAVIHKVTHLSLINSAYVLNGLLQALISLSFIKLCKQLGANQRTQFFALLIILLLPQLCDYRHYIIRDFGYWAFYLTSLVTFIHYCRKPSLLSAALWMFTALIACAFRIEGALFLIFMPLAILSFNSSTKVSSFIKICVFPACAVFAYFLWHMLANNDAQSLSRLTEFQTIIKDNLFLIDDRFNHASQALQQQGLIPAAKGGAATIMVFGLMGLYIYKLIATISLVYIPLVCTAIYQCIFKPLKNERKILYAAIVINIMITAYFISLFHFINPRYIMPLALTLLLWAPFGLEFIWHYFLNRLTIYKFKSTIYACFSVLLIALTVNAIINFSPSKAYIREAGIWLKHNTTSNESIYTNVPQLLLFAKGPYSGLQQDWDKNLEKLNNNSWQQYDYLAIKLKKSNHQSAPSPLNNTLVKQFNDDNNNVILVYKNNNNAIQP